MELTQNEPSRPISSLHVRLKAALIHLVISALAVCTVLLLIIGVWYPGPLFYAAGGSKLITILATVDIIIGPCITLIIFDRKKKELWFDLGIVAILQAAA